jgi:hypothetical protein
MKNALLLLEILLLPCLAFAGTDCRMIDLKDHVELVCVGDEKFTPAPTTAAQRPAAAPRIESEPVAPVKAQAPEVAKPAVPVLAKSDSVRAYHAYLQRDLQRGADLASKRAHRLKMIQDEMRRHPAPPVAEQSVAPEDSQ